MDICKASRGSAFFDPSFLQDRQDPLLVADCRTSKPRQSQAFICLESRSIYMPALLKKHLVRFKLYVSYSFSHSDSFSKCYEVFCLPFQIFLPFFLSFRFAWNVYPHAFNWRKTFPLIISLLTHSSIWAHFNI